MSLGALRHLDLELRALSDRGLLRSDQPIDVGHQVSLCSNDYLGLAEESVTVAAGRRGGAGASRLVHGEHASHRRAEDAFATWLGFESALLFTSGYAANVGAISALCGPGDLIVSDALNHASIIDGCRLSGARVQVVEHLNVEAVSEALRLSGGARRRWVVTESYFSMDGDSPDLCGLRRACDRWDAALIVDEAHSVGVFGDEGRGLCAAFGVRPDVLVAACGKAIGLQGGLVLGPRVLRSWLWNRARSFVFSTGVSPLLADLLTERVARVRRADREREGLASAVGALRGMLKLVNATLPTTVGPILPWVHGEPGAALDRAAQFGARGVLVQAIRPPTVPAGSARLRLTARASLSSADLATVSRAFECFT